MQKVVARKGLLFLFVFLAISAIGTIPMMLADGTDGGGGGTYYPWTRARLVILENDWQASPSRTGMCQFRANPSSGSTEMILEKEITITQISYLKIHIYWSYNVKSTGSMQARYKLMSHLYKPNGIGMASGVDTQVNLYKPNYDSSETWIASGNDYHRYIGLEWVKCTTTGTWTFKVFVQATHWSPGGYCYRSTGSSYYAYMDIPTVVLTITTNPPPIFYNGG
ncbi:MAG: hypothetical protein GF411_10780 [Candidatus Lokiarchaeota archaeon]|nr:hypothetical protein [Candidatus Lokiarchaeota archaeon]